MFDSPLPKAHRTIYSDLGVGPDATPDEIRSAKQRVVGELKFEKQQVDRKIQQMLADLPGVAPESGGVKAEDTKKALHRLASAKYPEFPPLYKKSKRLERKLEELNGFQIEDPNWRENYDQSHPPCALMKLEDCSIKLFEDSKISVFLLRRTIVQFLTTRHVPCFHPSDLTRFDFVSDFTYNPMLDEEN